MALVTTIQSPSEFKQAQHAATDPIRSARISGIIIYAIIIGVNVFLIGAYASNMVNWFDTKHIQVVFDVIPQ